MDFSKELGQIRYYFGENSFHEKGLGVAPVNLSCIINDIEKNYSQFQLGYNLYLIKGVILDTIMSMKSRDSHFYNERKGTLGLRIIGNSSEMIEDCAKHFNLPFNKKVIIPNLSDLNKINGLYLEDVLN